MTLEEAKRFRAQMDALKGEFDGDFWNGRVRNAIHLLADTVADFNDRITALENGSD